MHVLEVDALEVRYPGTLAVQNVDFTVERGEIFGLIGPNGAGKTSTLAVIEGLRRPSAGTVRVLGIDVSAEPRRARAQLGVQLQAQSFQPELTLTELVQLYAGLYGIRLAASEARARLEAAGLGPQCSRRVGQLSGGQSQRLGLLIANMHAPALLLLDEPTTGLDPQARRELWNLVETVRAQDRSVLLTTHSIEEAAALSDRIGILVRGHLVAVASPEELVRRYAQDPQVTRWAHGSVTLEDVFLALCAQGEVPA